MMGDLLKNMRSSQVFSVCGLPEVRLKKIKGKDNEILYQAELLGLDAFDPVTGVVDSRPANDVPCWMLDNDYNDLCFHVSQAFFPAHGSLGQTEESARREPTRTPFGTTWPER